MKPVERGIVYGLLALLLIVNVRTLVSDDSNAVHADSVEWWSDLGPAEALRLSREDGEDLVVRNVNDRLSWGETAGHRSYSLGLVYVGEIMRQLMAGEAFVEERETLAGELREQEEQFFAQRQALEDRYRDVGPDDPAVEEGRREFNQLRQQYERFRAEAARRQAALAAGHLEQAYRELVTAVNVVADRKGIDVVQRFIPTDDEFESVDPDNALAAIRLRSMVRYPTDLDLTPDVLEELALEQE